MIGTIPAPFSGISTLKGIKILLNLPCNLQFMKKYLFGLAATLFVSMVFVSCEKGSDTPSKSKTELISQQSWKFSAATANGIDISASIDDCYKDNIITFNASGGTGNVSEAAIVCNPSTAGNFTWSFQNGENELQVSTSLFAGGSGNFDIITLNETTLVLAQDMTIPPFPTTNVRITFVH